MYWEFLLLQVSNIFEVISEWFIKLNTVFMISKISSIHFLSTIGIQQFILSDSTQIILLVFSVLSLFVIAFLIMKYISLGKSSGKKIEKINHDHCLRFSQLKGLYNKLDQQLKFTLAGARAGSFLYYCDTDKVSFDNRALELLGIKRNEGFYNMNDLFSLISEDNEENLEKRFYEIVKSLNFWEGTFRLKSEKNQKYIGIQCYIHRDKNNIPNQVYGMLSDITDKKIRELELKQNENKFRLVFEKSKDGLILIDNEGVVKSINKAACDILNDEMENIKGKNFIDLDLELIHENGNLYEKEERPVYISLNTGKQVNDKIIGLVLQDKVKWLKVNTIPFIKEGKLWPEMIFIHFEDVSHQRKMINELQRSENKYRNLADNALIGIFRATTKGEISYINKSLSDLLEYNSQIDVIGKNPMFWFARNEDRRYFYQALKDNVVVDNFHTILKTSRNSKINVIINAQWINDSISGMVMDITEIIKTRDELKQSKENFKRIFTSIQEGYILFGINGNIHSVNPSAVKILGTSSESELSRLNFRDDILRESSRFQEIIELLKHKEKLNAYQVGFKDANGKVFIADCNMHFLMDKKGRPSYVECTFRDVTYRRRVEESLKTLLELNKIMESYSLEEMVNHGLEEAVRLTNSKIGFFHFVNEKEQTISLQSWSKETLLNCEVTGKNEHYPIKEAGVWVECIKERKPVIHNRYENLEHKKGLPDGHFPLLREMVVPIFESKRIVAVVGVGNKDDAYNEFDVDQLSLLGENIWSIIRRKRVEDELKVARDIAEGANKAKSAFLANVSHEIRTPMNAVIGFSELLMNQIEDPIQKNYLESIKTSGNSLLHIINDILDLSKIEAGKMDVNFEPCSIEEILEDVKHIFSLKAQQKDLDLILKFPGNNRYLFNIDELRVRQILLNLVSNAIKFTNEGYIKVEVEVLQRRKRKNARDLIISVKDTGIGISRDALQSIFESFKQQEEQDVKSRFMKAGSTQYLT